MQRTARNNTLAGLFVVGSVTLGVAVSFLLAERGAGMNATRFIVRFPVSQGAAGIAEGSPVLLGGQQVGRVLSVGFSGEPASNVDVRGEVREDVVLYENASVYLDKPLLGSLSAINITSAGADGGEGEKFVGKSARIEAGEVVGAGQAPGLLAQAGLGAEQLDQIKRTLDNLDKSMARISNLINSSSPDIEGAIADARALVGDAKANFSGWDGQIDATLTNAEKASARIDPLFTKVEQSVDSATKVFEEARAIVTENRTQIEEILAKVNSAVTKIDNESVGLLNDALKDARGAMAQAQQAIADVDALLTEQRPNIRKAMANMRLTSDQLKLAAIEVRSQPWRLLHEPDTKELSTQALYDATRSYASAASDVRAASEALSQVSLMQRTGATMSDTDLAKNLADLSERLRTSMEGFSAAERKLLETLVNEGK